MSFNFLTGDQVMNGDLGLSSMPTVKIEDIPIIVPHVANILSHLDYDNRKIANYCFVFWKPISNTYTFAQLEKARELLPANVIFYEVDGKRFFDVKTGPSEPIVKQCCYLIQKG